MLDAVLGFDTVDEYEANKDLYFGATVGRVANRTAEANFSLDGVTYQLARNDGVNHLHGGVLRSLDRVVWDVMPSGPDRTSVRFAYTSPHLEEGYPGNLDVTVVYTLIRENGLRIDYQAVSDRRTPINLTHHTYWNLTGEAGQTIDGHSLTVMADEYTPTDDYLIPLGPKASVANTSLDFRLPKELGPTIGSLAGRPSLGLDHNFVLRDWDSTLQHAARLQRSANGLVMDMYTTEPGIQVYSSGHMPATRGKSGVVYPTRGGICLEAQHFPDSLHHPEYPEMVLEPGNTYRQTTEYRFSVL
jgi:aldose 1-epimerase